MQSRMCLHLLIALAMVTFNGETQAQTSSLRRIDAQPALGLAVAVVVENRDLVHTGQLLPHATDVAQTPRFSQQLDLVWRQLETVLSRFQAQRKDVVKLNFYVADAASRFAVQQQVTQWFGEDQLPAVAYVATPLPVPQALVAVDAVFAIPPADETNRPLLRHLDAFPGVPRQAQAAILPQGDAIYIAGQAEPGDLRTATRATLESLLRSLRELQLDRQHFVQLKCFLQPMTNVATVQEEIAQFFGDDLIPPVVYVEWISGTLPIEIEAVAYAPASAFADTVSYPPLSWLKPSPVFSRVARIHGNRRIYISGLYSQENETAEGEIRNVFGSLAKVLLASGSDMKHLVKATYYVATEEASAELNRFRPSVYDPQRPPSASKAMVKDVAARGKNITLDMIAVPTEK